MLLATITITIAISSHLNNNNKNNNIINNNTTITKNKKKQKTNNLNNINSSSNNNSNNNIGLSCLRFLQPAPDQPGSQPPMHLSMSISSQPPLQWGLHSIRHVLPSGHWAVRNNKHKLI